MSSMLHRCSKYSKISVNPTASHMLFLNVRPLTPHTSLAAGQCHSARTTVSGSLQQKRHSSSFTIPRLSRLLLVGRISLQARHKNTFVGFGICNFQIDFHITVYPDFCISGLPNNPIWVFVSTQGEGTNQLRFCFSKNISNESNLSPTSKCKYFKYNTNTNVICVVK